MKYLKERVKNPDRFIWTVTKATKYELDMWRDSKITQIMEAHNV